MATKNLTDDRNYYRMLTDEELLELTKTIKTNELSIVLAERLRKAKNERHHNEEEY